MNGLFYKRGNWEEYLIRKGDDAWQYISRGFYGRDELNVTRPFEKIMRVIRDSKPAMPYTEEDRAAFAVLAEKYPWMRGFDSEIMNRMKVNMYALLIHAAKHEWNEVADWIRNYHQLNEGELKHIFLDHMDNLSLDRLCINQIERRIIFGHRPWRGEDGRGYYVYGEDVLHDFMIRNTPGGLYRMGWRYFLSGEMKKILMGLFDDLSVEAQRVGNGEASFGVAEYPQGVIAFKKLARERKYSFSGFPYQFIVLKKESDEMGLLNGDWEEFVDSFSYEQFCFTDSHGLTDARRRERCRRLAEPLLAAAKRNCDPYAVCHIKHLSGMDTEEDCAYLYQQDGIMRYVKDPVELVPRRIEVTESHFYIIKYSGKSRYDCRVKVDDKDYTTDWDPWRPETITVYEYHHMVRFHLTEAQQQYMWETVKADKESNPMGRPLGWNPNHAGYYLGG